jgi:hypothetical protein
MEINVDKLCLILPKTPNDIASEISGTLAYPNKDLHLGFNYLGFYLKPNNHRYMDYIWLLKKVESRISLWFNNFLSHGRRIMLVKLSLKEFSFTRINSSYFKRNPDRT